MLALLKSDISCDSMLAVCGCMYAFMVYNTSSQRGHFLERTTNEIFISTVHRAINKTPGAERYSFPLFLSQSYDAMIDTVPTRTSEDRPKASEPVLAEDWQKERLYRSRYKYQTAVVAKVQGNA